LTVSLWRIAVEAPAYAATDLTGAGAKISGGRWNSKGTAVVYCATNIALTTIETVVYLGSGRLPFNRYLVRVDIPDAVWDKRTASNPLPGGWDAVPAGPTSKLAGDRWVAAGTAALLQVPSVIVPDEHNILINPQHADAAGITAFTVRRWIYDLRFFP
jgi:RES domain-containing protein